MPSVRKSNQNKSKSFLDNDRYTAELTSGQLVFGISILLVFGLTCFLLGILVGRFEPAVTQQVALAESETATSTPASTKPAETEPPQRTMTRRTIPLDGAAAKEPVREDNLREDNVREDKATAKTDAPPASDSNRIAKADTAKETTAPESTPRNLGGPRPVEIPESPGITIAKPEASESPTNPPAEKKAASEEKPAETVVASATPVKEEPAPTAIPLNDNPAPAVSPSVSTPTVDQPSTSQPESPGVSKPGVVKPTEPKAIEPQEPTMKVASAPTPPAEPLTQSKEIAKPATPEKPAANGAFTIQVAAMSKASNADALKNRFESETTHSVQIQQIPSKGLSIVNIGSFATRAEADTALRAFRTKYPQFSDAFIRARN